MTSVRLALPTKDPKTEITVGLRSDRPMADLKASLIKKYETELLPPPVGSAGDGWVVTLYDPEKDSLSILDEFSTLDQVDVKPPMRVDMKHRCYVAKIRLSDSSLKTVLLDRTKTVAELLQHLSRKFSVEEFVLSFGLRKSSSVVSLPRDADLYAPSDEPATPRRWLSPELRLWEQGISDADDLIFCKRFLGPWDTDERLNSQNFQMAFWEARCHYLDGSLDSYLTLDICVELSSLLLILSITRSDLRVISSMSAELASETLPRWWREKQEWRENLWRLEACYSGLCDTNWTNDLSRVRQRFIAVVIGFPNVSSCQFHFPRLSFSNDTEVEPACIVVDSSGIEFRSTRPSAAFTQLTHWADRPKGPFSFYRLKMDEIVRLSVEGQILSVCFSIYSQALVIACGQSHRARDCADIITAFRHLASLQSSPHAISVPDPPNTTMNFFDTLFCRNPSSVIEAASLAFESLKRIRVVFDSAARLEPNSYTVHDFDNSTLSIAQWFSQAATHLRGVVAGSASICKGILSGGFLLTPNSQASVSELLKWGMELDSMTKSLLRGVQFALSNSQALATMTSNLLLICCNMLKSVSKLSPAETLGHSVKVQVVALDRALATAASALDLALRGHLSDETTCLSLVLICRDIESMAQELFQHCQRVLPRVSSDPDRTLLETEMSKSRAVLSACLPLVLVNAFVDCSESSDLLARMQSSLDALSSSTKSLLSHLMELSSKEDDKFSEAITSARWSWGSLDHSLRIYYLISANSELPSSDIDPMLPIPIYDLVLSIDRAFQGLGRNPDDYALVEESASSIVRTLAKLLKLQKSADIVSISAKLQSTLRKQRRPPKRMSRPSAPNERLHSCLQYFDISVDAVFRLFSVPSGRNDRLRFELRQLLTYMVVLRSILSKAAVAPFEITDFECVSRHVEELDVLLHEILPVFSSAFGALRSDLAMDSPFFPSLCRNMDQLQEHLDSIVSRIRSNSYFFGPFFSSLDLIISRLNVKWVSYRTSLEDANPVAPDAPAKAIPRALTSPDLPLRRKSMSLTLRGTTGSLFPRGSLSSSKSTDSVPLTPSESTRRASSPDDLDLSPISERIEGNVEITSEESLLSLIYNMIVTGQVIGLEMNFKDALDLCLLTCPYWTCTETVAAKISSALSSGLPFRDVDERLCSRVAVALSKLLHFLPDAVHDPGTRLVVGDALSLFKNHASPQVAENADLLETAIKDALESLSRCHNLKEMQISISSNTQGQRIDLLTVDLDEMATQMTLAEEKYFKAVNIPDFLRTSWTKRENALSLWIDHTNSTARWIATRIIQTPQRKDRAKLITRFLKLAELLRIKGNFASMITIFLGLSMEAVTRLKKTWESSSGSLQSKFEQLENTILPLCNFSGYREELKRAGVPSIPYMAVLTRDLVNLEEVMATIKLAPPPGSLLSGPLFNFAHLSTLARLISNQFVRFRRASYPGDVHSDTWCELFHPAAFGILTEKDQLAAAELVEPEKRKVPRKIVIPAIPLRSATTEREILSYGVRSELGRSSLSMPVPQPKQRPLWVEHSSKCAAALESLQNSFAESGRVRLSQTSAALAAEFNVDVISHGSSPPASESRNDEGIHNTFQRSKTLDDRDMSAMEPISASLITQDKVLHALLPWFCARSEWKMAPALGENTKRAGILIRNSSGFHSLVISIILAVLPYFQEGTGKVVGNRVGTVISGDKSVAVLRYTITSETPPTDIEPDVTFVLSHLSSRQSVIFKELQGTLEFSKSAVVTVASLDLMLPLKALEM
eukprot:TRINITY_DN2087_c0_g1_i1.p1 TRINITY_DN2087_c0_g1~~TRINITY_DN2087_c0_g1_i1.p1  ORF type:complete len:1769 (+),score=172.83 TRINITY_DN2087_c0_g1_i1:87-5393(+)